MMLMQPRRNVALVLLAGLLMSGSPAAAATPTAAESLSARPFPAPVTTGTVTVPASVTTGAGFNDWLSGVPDGSFVEFPTNASIDLDTGFAIEQRNNLVLRLNGSTLRVEGPGDVPDSSPFFIRQSSHVAIEGPAVVLGNNPNTTTVFTPGSENSHVLALSGWGGEGPSSYVEISGIEARNIYGDFAYLEGRNISPNEPSNHIWVHDNAGDYIGRNAVSFINCTDVLVEGNTFDHIGMDALDIEPNLADEQVRRGTFRNNKIGVYALMTGFEGWFLNTWNAPLVAPEDITLDANEVVGNPSSGFSRSPRGLHVNVDHAGRPKNIQVTNNRTAQPAPGPVMRFVNVEGLIVEANVQPLTSGALETLDEPTGLRGMLIYGIGAALLIALAAAAALLAWRVLRRRRRATPGVSGEPGRT
jgi:hypothetical protein